MPRFNPPAPAITTNGVRITVRGQFEANAIYNVFDYMSRNAVALTPAILTALMNSWVTNNSTVYAGCFATDYTTTSLLAADTFASVVPTQFITVSGTGTVTGDSLPSFNSAIITKQSNLKGQHGRGRMYMGPVPQGFVTAGTQPNEINATAIAAYQALRNSLLNPLNAGATLWDWVVTTRPIPPDHFITKAVVITSAPIDVVMGTTRRRIQGRGI